jgi:AmmeMemoRadiSam system protein A
MSYSLTEKKQLLKLAHDSINAGLTGTEFNFEVNTLVSKELKKERACFVTLTIDGQLRGCIGHLLPIQELYKDVIDNAQSAAFSDPRFPGLSEEEFEKIKIEISVLSIPEPLNYSSPAELISYLKKNKPGLIISKGYAQATFLPSVWDEISTVEQFLTELCLKAGLAEDEWKKGKLKVQTYEAEKFE